VSSLAHLATIPVERVKHLAGTRARRLREAGVASVSDLLQHVPRRYIDRSRITALSERPIGDEVTVIGEVASVSSRRPRRKLVIVEAVVTDGTGEIKAVWFNQAFRARQLTVGSEVALSGKVESFRGSLQMKSPDVDLIRSSSESLVTARVVPVYSTIGGVSSGHIRRAMHNALRRSRPITDPLPADIVERLGLMGRDQAFADIHFPETPDDTVPARRRLVFDELFRLEVALALKKRAMIETAHAVAHAPDGKLTVPFVAGLPFQLTGAQQRVMDEIDRDLRSPYPMHRLLLGEVGSGKTVVAVAALLAGVEGGYQGAIMAPTEVLASQHYLSVTDLLERSGVAPARDDRPNLFEDQGDGVKVVLLTSSTAEANFRPQATREDVLSLVRSGDVDIVVGTHALIQEGVDFASLGVAVIDEQHRFGVHQRVSLKEKAGDFDPDLLIMTATPIPRTLTMTLYGDLDVSTLDEMPPGRPKVHTIAVAPMDVAGAYRKIRDEAAAGHQTFVVCPLVEDSPKVEAASATAEYERFRKLFPNLRVGLLHGQMRSADKREIMESLRRGDIDLLVSTTVIEVGIDIPNSTVMVIEDADRFGLSQLHQLRGRLARHTGPNWCYLVAEPTTDEGAARIEAMVSTDDGFQLAEIDLAIRGQGTVFGARQSGLTDLRLADILRDREELVAATREAFSLVDRDPHLEAHQEIGDEVRALLGDEVEWLFRS
jgi:ATP-dependent DNA helicase RecG